MHIKRIRIAGFKSYRDEGAKNGGAEFSPTVNCLVGSNGTGKSNFFAAVQFVLGHGQYRTITQDMRRQLLYEGLGNKVLSAFVELTFDNSAARLNLDTESPEVVIRRTIGAKIDEYRVNERSTPASEVAAMLEAAGLSPSNPYNVVQQGRITMFGDMTDEARFAVLKEVAGTSVYEQRRARSEEMLVAVEKDLEAVEENIAVLDKKLEELGQEREEFKVYRAEETRHRCLQYGLFKKEADTASAELEKIKVAVGESDAVAERSFAQIKKLGEEAKKAEAEAGAAEVAIMQAKRQRQVILQERDGWVRSLARVQVTLNAEEAQKKENAASLAAAEAALAEVRGEVAATKKKLEAALQQLSVLEAEDLSNQGEVRKVEARVGQLVTKRGRHNQFSTQAERDAWLAQEVAKQQKNLKQYAADEAKVKKEAEEELPAKIRALEDKMRASRGELAKGQEGNAARQKEIKRLKGERDALAEQRREMFREQAKVQQRAGELRAEEQKCQQRVMKTMPRDIHLGQKSVEEVLRQENIEGVYGTVVSLFDCPEELHTCCDVMASNSLFNIVVDSNHTASKILRAMNARRLPGRPSFYPLNKLTARAKALPTIEGSCFPLYEQLKFDPKFAPVMADLFGRVLVCHNLTEASALSKQHNCDCVLVSGDKVDARGGISGGYFGDKLSKMGASHALRGKAAEAQGLQRELDGFAERASALDQEMLRARDALQKEEDEAVRFSRERERESFDVRAGEQDVQRLQAVQRQRVKDAARMRADVEAAEASIAALKEELAQPMAQKLSDAEAAELKELQLRLDAMKKEFSAKAAEVEAARGAVRQLGNTLEVNLERRRAELEAKAAELSAKTDSARDVTRHGQDVAMMRSRVAALDAELKEVEAAVDAKTAAKAAASEKAEKTRAELKKAKLKAFGEQTGVDEQKRKQAVLQDKIENANAQIRKLGALPLGYEEYEKKTATMRTREIQAAIGDAHAKLKALTHVNRKAYDQFSEVSTRREHLAKQLQERRSESHQIADMIKALDEKKDEAVLLTFKQVALGFQKSFKDLVGHPHAEGHLEMRKTGTGSKVNEFTGVGVRVNFGVGGDVTDVARLSGGQKSLVALSLIFAIQTCDPAPFYIFDEIDAALDPTYRINVATKIRELAKTAQFLVVSFKPEIVDIADKHFRISFSNKVSSLRRCSREQAHAELQRQAAVAARRRDDEPTPEV